MLTAATAGVVALAAACGGGGDDGDGGSAAAGSGSSPGSGAAGSGGVLSTGSTGSGSTGSGGVPFEECAGQTAEQELLGGPLDIYLVFDRTASMRNLTSSAQDDCDYVHGSTPGVGSKACYATYALGDYLIDQTPEVDTRLAFQFMSLADDDCDGGPYQTPLVGLTQLPVPENNAIVQAISDESFEGGLGTHIEGALNGIAYFTANNLTAGREMIGVLMTDGDPNGCDEDIDTLAQIIADHLAATGIRTFIIGMEGATNSNLEALAVAGGAEPHDDWCGDGDAPCHYWNVGDGSGDAIASALQAIIGQAVPLPCDYAVVNLEPPAGQTVDYAKVNVTLTDPSDATTFMGQAPNAAACPTDQPAWYYDDPVNPTEIHLCPLACETVTTAPEGSHVTVVLGCIDTVTIR